MLVTLTVCQPEEITAYYNVLQVVTDWYKALILQVEVNDFSNLTAASYKRGMGIFLQWCDLVQEIATWIEAIATYLAVVVVLFNDEIIEW